MEASVWIEARKRAPHLTIVGWFHSHPDLGAGFSSTDRNTQRNFFRLPHQLGLVIDPFRKQIACFAGADSTDVSSMLGSTEKIYSEDAHAATTSLYSARDSTG
jgi:proteasome lid subunit RPN8/RPN11